MWNEVIISQWILTSSASLCFLVTLDETQINKHKNKKVAKILTASNYAKNHNLLRGMPLNLKEKYNYSNR